MRLRLSCQIFVVLFFILQIYDVGSRSLDDESLLLLQLRVENLIEKIINHLQDYYRQIKADLKCIPDFISESVVELLKNAVECVQRNEKNLDHMKGTMKQRSKKFLECFANSKRELKEIMNSVNTSIDYCPDNITEKTYQINVSTIFTKTFRINIRNGVELLKKDIELERGTKHCFDHSMDVDYGSEEGWGEAEFEIEDDDDVKMCDKEGGCTESSEEADESNEEANESNEEANESNEEANESNEEANESNEEVHESNEEAEESSDISSNTTEETTENKKGESSAHTPRTSDTSTITTTTPIPERPTDNADAETLDEKTGDSESSTDESSEAEMESQENEEDVTPPENADDYDHSENGDDGTAGYIEYHEVDDDDDDQDGGADLGTHVADDGLYQTEIEVTEEEENPKIAANTPKPNDMEGMTRRAGKNFRNEEKDEDKTGASSVTTNLSYTEKLK